MAKRNLGSGVLSKTRTGRRALPDRKAGKLALRRFYSLIKMWNSPNKTSERGKRYSFEELAVLIYPLAEILDFLEDMPVADIFNERILIRMTKEELVYALYETFQALLENVAVPRSGHPGYQEAIVADLLTQTRDRISMELLDSAEGAMTAREAAWASIRRSALQDNLDARLSWSSLIDDLGLDLDEPQGYRSNRLTLEVWDDLITEGGLWNEFLWDEDWRSDMLMDLPTEETEPLMKLMGLNLGVTQSLPHSSSDSEYRMARAYLQSLSARFDEPFA